MGLLEVARAGISLSDIAEFFGVYKIICRKTGRSYIGQSNNVLGRIGGHLRALETGAHSNKELQEDYNLYGNGEFDVYFLERTSDYARREAHYIAEIAIVNEGNVYNVIRKVDGNLMHTIRRAIDAIKDSPTCPQCGYEFEEE